MNKQSMRFAIIVGVFLLPFVPFLVSSSLFFPYITTKAFAFRLIVEVVVALWLILAVSSPEYRPKKSPIIYTTLVFLLVIGAANLFGIDPSNSFWSNFERMEGYITLLHLGALFLVISSVLNEENWLSFWKANLFASFLMAVYGAFQLAGVITISQGGVRVDGTLGNATYLGGYMLFHIFMAIYVLWKERNKESARWIYGLLILSQLFVLYHTATRGAILGLIGGLLVMAILNWRNKFSKTLIISLVVLASLFYFVKDTAFVSKSPVLSRFTNLSVEEFNRGGRWFVWPMALEGFKERPILGWGQDNFIYIFQRHYQPEMFALEPWFDRAHNIFLDWLVAGGIIGLLSYLSLYGALLYMIWRKPMRSSPGASHSHIEKSILTGLIVAYFFHNFFVFDNLVSYLLFFSLLAFAHSRGAVVWSAKVFKESLVKNLVVPGTVLVFALIFYFATWRPILTNVFLIEALKSAQLQKFDQAQDYFQKAFRSSTLGRSEVAEHLAINSLPILSSDWPLEKRNEFYMWAKAAEIENANAYSLDARKQLLTGSFLVNTGQTDEALGFLEKARQIMPNKQQVYFDIGSAYFVKSEKLKGLEYFKTAYELAPGYPEAQIVYLLGAIYTGDRTIENRLLGEIREKELVFNDRVLNAYYSQGRLMEVRQIIDARKRLDPNNASRYDEMIRQL